MPRLSTPRPSSFYPLRGLALGCSLALAACGGSDSGDSPAAAAGRESSKAIAAPAAATWSPLIPLTLVPSSAANLPNGKLLLWSSGDRFSFPVYGQTYTSLFDPLTQTATETLVTQTGHDMFCTGTANLPDGSLLINGGDDSGKTSLYNPVTGTWSSGAAMNITRGYEANTVLQDGSVMTLGGSWSGGQGGKNAEVWTAAGGWKRLTGVPVDPAVAPDPAGVYRGDNHMWLFAAPNGQVLHAGPSASMNWINTQGTGQIAPAGPRGDDAYSQSGNAVMYDIGKILKAGGAPAYENATATGNAYVIDINAGVSVRKVAPMAYARIFSTAVVLPNGQVLVIGGQTVGKPFSDDNSALVPELWDPKTETFTMLPPIAVGRNYHSVALLLPDARVLSGGGGLCGAGCAGNHPDAQILTPHYLLNADGTPATRPVITSAPAKATQGTSIAVTTDSAIDSFALIRLSSTTHTVNNDQRRIPLQATATGSGAYSLALPSNPGVLLPGYYMLFAMNAAGVPSVSKTLLVNGDAAPSLINPGTQTGSTGFAVQLALGATTPSGALSYAATGLPPGLSIDAASGLISGTPTTDGSYVVNLSVGNGVAVTSTLFAWNIATPSATASWVKLEALSEINGNAWSSMAEFNLLDRSGATIDRTGWAVSADSAEIQGENGAAVNAIDGNPATFWHTQWSTANPPPPHSFIVNLGSARAIGGFKYLPRPGGGNGTIANWRFWTSNDGSHWALVGQGNFNDLGDKAAEKTVTLNRPPSLAAIANANTALGQSVSLALSAGDPDGDTLSFAASGLPPGLSLNGASGLISGVPTTSGAFPVTVQVSDGRNAPVAASFTWTITAPPLALSPVLATPQVAGSTASFTAASNGGAGVRYRWNFGDGSADTADSTIATASHAYAAPGLYTVTVTATDAGGTVKVLTFTQAIYSAVSGSLRPTQSSTLALQANRVWLVNQDNDSVSVFDAGARSRLAEITVGSAPRSIAVAPDGRVWVANKGDATISIVNPTTSLVVQTVPLPRASMPFGLAFAPDGSAAYVALEATGQLLKLNPGTGATLGAVNVGPNPRQIAITAASDRILVSRFISPPLPGEGTPAVQTQVNGVNRGGEVVVVTPALAIERTIVLQVSGKADSTAQGRGLPNYLAAPAISPDGRSAWVPSKQDNVQRGSLRDGNNLDFQNTVRSISSRIDLGTFAEDYAARVDHDNSGLASAAAFHPSGAYLFVALQTSRHIAIIDPVKKAELYRFDAGRAPDGVAVSADGLTLYVNNFMDRTLGIFDLTRLVNYGELNVPLLGAITAVTTDKLSAPVLAGKQLFYDARDTRLARDSYMSCAACHNDGGHDGRVWDFTGLGEGLRNTISLRGRAGAQGFKHWSGNFDEIQDFEGQIRTFAQGTGLMSDALFNAGTRSTPLGDPKAGLSADLDALAAYVKSLDSFAPNPNRNADGSLTAQAVVGKKVFIANCASCHSGAAMTDSGANTLHDIGTLKASSGKRLGGPLTGIDTPTLRDVWATGPYLHDGSAATIPAAISAHTKIALTADQLASVAAYVQQVGGEEQVAAYSIANVRYVKLEALSEVNGNPWTSMAEFNLFDGNGELMNRSGWVATADSAEAKSENGAAANAIDGNPATIWHTAYSSGSAPLPHSLVVNLGAARSVSGFKMLPRTGVANGTIAAWRFFTSADGVTWTLAGQGNFKDLGATAAEKTVMLTPAPITSGIRYVKLDALSEINGNAWASMAEFNLLDASGAVMARTGWSASADSAEAKAENGAASNAIDGNTGTIWHTGYSAGNVPMPHSFTVNLGATRSIGGFRYTPRNGGGNGTIAGWRFSTSVDGVNWVASGQGNFKDLGAAAAVKTVLLAN